MTLILLALSLMVPLWLGFVAVTLLWPKSEGQAPSILLRGSLGLGFGFGIVSFLMFFYLMFFGRWSPAFNVVLALASLLGLVLFLKYHPRNKNPGTSAPSTEFEQILYLYFYIFLAFAVAISVFYFLQNPHGNWDAWSHWNLRARFVMRAGRNWDHALSPDYWNPLNYPLFLPMVVSAAWGWIGKETLWFPGLTGLCFTVGTALLLLAGLSRVRGRSQGLLAAILLLGTPFFLTHGNSQYSDIPLSFFFLASFVFTALHDFEARASNRFLILAGAMAGMSAWTKNEGLLFIACFFAARWLTLLGEKGWRAAWRDAFWLGVGLAPVLAVVVYVKTQLYPPQTILITRNVPYTFSHFSDPVRYQKILGAFYHTISQFGAWTFSLPLVLMIYLVWMRFTRSKTARRSGSRVLLTLFFVLAGYFTVYMATPHDIDWLLGTSVHRIFLCLWPSFLLGFCLLTRSPEEALQTVENLHTEIAQRERGDLQCT